MKKGVIITLGVIVAVILIVVFSAIGGYNGLVSGRESVSSAFSQIDVQLQRRTDLIPNLVSTVKGFAAQEQDVIDSVTTARAQLAGAQTVGEKAEADSVLNSALSRLMVIVENYPELKSDANFRQLSDELAGTENRISVARKDYNEAVQSYNNMVVRFPNNIWAGMFGFQKAEYFEAAAGSDQVPEVDFSK